MPMFRRPSPPPQLSRPRAPRDKRAYVIGDVHGCLTELKSLLALIEADNQTRSKKKTYIVFVGDLIDRGPASRGVIEHLMNHTPGFADYVFIKGNHEESLLRGLGGEPELLQSWLAHGGYSTAESYGVMRSQLMLKKTSELETVLKWAIPDEHLAFLETFVDSAEFGDYFFVHAGVRPDVALSQQVGRDLHWIRDAFLEHKEAFSKIIVHGHTIVDAIEVHPNRIAVDTGAYKTGILSALCIDGAGLYQLSTKPA